MPNWKKVIISGSDAVLTSVIATAGFTGSLLGTASFASTASFITASGVYGPYGSNSVISASYALNALSASYAVTSSYGLNPTISGSINNVNYIDFNTGSATPTWKSGRVFWDNTDGCLAVYNAEQDITLQVGQENWTRVRNNTGTTITNGTAVRLAGSQGDVPTVVRAQSIQKSGSVNVDNQILGVATHDIENSSFGYITTQGLVRGLNTNAFNDGDTLFVGTGSAGVLQNTAPRAPFEIIPVGVCVKASPGGSGIIYVAVQEPIDFSDLSSVLVSGSYHYGDLWTYVPSGSFGVWTHTNRLSGSYSVTGSWSATSFTGSLQGTSSWASNAITASYVLNAVSSSFASTASFVQNAQTASYVLNAVSSSFATSASFASTVPASGVIGLNLSQIATASFTASVSPTQFTVTSASITEFTVTGTGVTIGNAITDTHRVTGSLNISGSTNINGNTQITGSLAVTQNITGSRMFLSSSNGTISGSTLTVYGSGSTLPVFTVQGSQGELFSITDSLSGSLFSVNDISGLPILEVFSDNTTLIGSYLDPMLITTTKVTQTNSGSFVVYSLPTASYDTAFFEYSIKSGSNARAGTIMAIQSGTSVNFTETTTTDIGNTTAVSFTVLVSGSNLALTGSSTTGSWTIKSIVRGI
jgi:hypothetical protein